ncbi:MAG: glutathione transferase GstA [Polyangiaceae bacterium]
MMKLYYSPGACSLSPHIALREAELPFELVRVDFANGRTTADGSTLDQVNPKSQVPALLLEDGQLLTEGAVMVQYIADRNPSRKLAPPNGTFERVRLQEWLNFMATELHKGMSPFYAKEAGAEYKEVLKQRMDKRFAYLEERLGTQPYLMGEHFTVADGYALYNLRAYKRFVRSELSSSLAAYAARIMERPTVKAAFAAEGIA